MEKITENLELIIKSGETKNLNTRTYQYSNVIIEKNGVLKISESSQNWFILWVTGNVTIEGTIIANNFKTGPRIITDSTPDGKIITHSFENNVEGGIGGNGGASADARIVQGGIGAVGTSKYGGGGGSGGGILISGSNTHIGGIGQNAIDWRGAPLATGSTDNFGGDGGRMSAKSNGGLLMIYCGGKFSGEGGIINIKGSNGSDGSDGGLGYFGYGVRGSGGGGGGSAGGDGGRAIIVSNNILAKCDIFADGGAGGIPGNAGLKPNGATKGTKGDDGNAGVVDWLTIDQWK